MFRFGISFGRNHLNSEGHIQMGCNSKTIKNYGPSQKQFVIQENISLTAAESREQVKIEFCNFNAITASFITKESMVQATVESVDEYLSNVYYDRKRPGSLYRDMKDEGKFKLSRKQISNWLVKLDTYTLHAPARQYFKRNRVIVGGIVKEWQLDLADIQSLMQYNNGYRYLLVCIDVFSKYAWMVPVK